LPRDEAPADQPPFADLRMIEDGSYHLARDTQHESLNGLNVADRRDKRKVSLSLKLHPFQNASLISILGKYSQQCSKWQRAMQKEKKGEAITSF